nr:bifunctional diguanylate cyclase/phosphodiesterase [uncultured Pseudodesulfovibrio sp.]
MHLKLPEYVLTDFKLDTIHTQTLVLITIRDYFTLREMYGQSFVDHLENELKASLQQTAKNNNTNSIQTNKIGPGVTAFLVPQDSNPADIAYGYKGQARMALGAIMLRHTGIGIDLGMGFASVPCNQQEKCTTIITQALRDARRMESRPLDMKNLSINTRFNTILTQKLISAHYQPIYDFRTSTTLGWEALARGPKGSSFRSPFMLFETAEELGRLFALEKLCREVAVNNVGTLSEQQKLFLNIHPKTMADPLFSPGHTRELLEKAQLTPDNIVFEITERHSVQDFDLFYRALDHYRNQGFQIAVDDAGAGYAGLSLIAELQPDYIKLDKSLIDDIHKDPVKRALVETTVTFADKIGSRIIAEGIEYKAQALCLKDIGVHCGQGFFLARPAYPKPRVGDECKNLKAVRDISSNITCSRPVGDLAETPHPEGLDCRVSQVHKFFRKNNQFSSIVIVEDNIPRGILMEYHLNRQLSSQYGIALYHKRSIASIMDDRPLVVDMETPVEQAARSAMQREHFKTYDDIIVTKKGKLYGVVTVQALLNALAEIQVEMAKGTNPLTGLPGNVAIEQEVERRIKQKESFSIIYGDLDHFKVYNDTYGFKNGDRIIKLAADIMSWAMKKHAPQDAQLCHIGGDDFVLITTPESVNRICKSITRCFGRLVHQCYCADDRARGWIKAKGRDGKKREYPLVTISLGVIEIFGQCSLMEIGERAAHIKKYAKSISGNSVAIDRRSAIGSDSTILIEQK